MADPHPPTQDPYKDPSFLRACLQETHYEEQRLHFLRHLIIYSTTPNSDILSVPNNRYTLIRKSLSELEPADIRQFCYKDCAIYGNAEKLGGVVPLRILDDVYREWFPHRAKDKDLKWGSFFGKYMGSELPNTIPLADLIAFHARLYLKVNSMEYEAIPKPGIMVGKPPEPQRGLYRMRDTFALVFIILDKTNWREDGVLLVFRDRESTTGFHVEGTEMEMEDVAPACVYRTSLKLAMKAVISRDEERRKRRKEWYDLNEEFYGSDDD
ncbi:hypothetical protein OEA41_004678 [Lepraria neglecta]|uniref:Uncharacterized protein n=1 Tax=Lepraria neglecta TaxID=209136 RepID=A0AAD9Z1H0_9LECA|nr:hypothetical protein OEA41_004678 [Lepraria neglecta]